MTKPPLSGYQPRRSVSFHILSEQYDELLRIQSRSPHRISISALAREFFDKGLKCDQ
jgi:hypothetical protein